MALTPKQNRFVAEYLVDQNATQAAIRAGYPARTARSVGAENLAKPYIKQCISEALERRNSRVEVKSDDVLRELLRVMSVDLGKAFDEDGRLLNIREMPEDVRRAVAGFEVEALFEGAGRDRMEVGTTTKVKMLDKVRAIELAMKHLGLLQEKVKLEGTVTLEQLVEASYRVGK